MYDQRILDIVKRLQRTRISLMQKQPFYAVLLLQMKLSLDPMCESVYTDGERIVFSDDDLETLSDTELEFVLMHEVLHAALSHHDRKLGDFDADLYDTACDIVVNSNILQSAKMDPKVITIRPGGEAMHKTPNGKEGYEFTAEEVYRMLETEMKKKSNMPGRSQGKEKEEGGDQKDADVGQGADGKEKEGGQGTAQDLRQGVSTRKDGGFDDHSYWNAEDDGSGGGGDSDATNLGHHDPYNEATQEEKRREKEQQWKQRMLAAAQLTQEILKNENGSKSRGTVPRGAERVVKELTEPQTDWRMVLDNFIQEEVNDYSFSPPDRRFQESPFLLPDYNEKDERVKDILFMIDTSGSMSDDMIRQAYSEIAGAFGQFDGKLQGWLGFFDAKATEPEEFTDEDEFRIIKPKGGGGTSFQCIFDYVKEHIDEMEPASIVILTDGYAPFPEEEETLGIPVLWIINNEDANPPWGKVTRIKV